MTDQPEPVRVDREALLARYHSRPADRAPDQTRGSLHDGVEYVAALIAHLVGRDLLVDRTDGQTVRYPANPEVTEPARVPVR